LRVPGERGKAPAMGVLSKIFTWWNGATVGTSLFTRMRGEQVGRDGDGNVYFRHKKNPARRWVIYDGSNDGSRVPPDWQLWLKGTIDELPDKALPPRRSFEKKPQANLTGTMAAFRPDGALGAGKIRPAATGDYQAWKPE
jgi:NADH:ubiquinone oxidoreductase subunit